MWYLHFAQAAPGGSQQSPLVFIMMIAGMIGIFYFLIMRPQKKQRQQREQMLSKIARGDRVVTIGGVFAEVATVKENYVILIVDRENDIKMKFSRSAVDRILVPEAAQEEEEKA